MSEALRLFGTRAIVTGAVDGIGEAIVRTFVKQGAAVFAVDRANTGIDTHYRSLRGVTPFIANAADADGSEAIVASAAEALGGLDVVVCNVGTQGKTPIDAGDGGDADAFVSRQLASYKALSDAALEHLEKSPAGRIVTIGCLRSAFSKDAAELFSAAQAKISDFTTGLAAKAGPDGITVNAVLPGAIMTPASRRIFNESKDLRDHCIRHSAAGRLGEPVDIAKVALFLASDDAVFVSGTGIVVDGGPR